MWGAARLNRSGPPEKTGVRLYHAPEASNFAEYVPKSGARQVRAPLFALFLIGCFNTLV